MSKSHPRLLSVLAVLAACAVDDRSRDPMIAFEPGVEAGIRPEVHFPEGGVDYSLTYFLSPDGTAIRTRFRGPSEALTAGLSIDEQVVGGEHQLVCTVRRSDYRVTLARWKVDANGRVCDAEVRTQPVVEIQPIGELERGQLVVDCEWRPFVDGKGVGPWRR